MNNKFNNVIGTLFRILNILNKEKLKSRKNKLQVIFDLLLCWGGKRKRPKRPLLTLFIFVNSLEKNELLSSENM